MRIPQVEDIDTALQIYYQYPELGSSEISQLFDISSRSTISRLKKAALEKMIEEDVLAHGSFKVNTEIAYKAWGIDINDLQHRRKMLIYLGFKKKN